MNRDDGPAPGAQRSVAELLAAYGADSRRDGPTRSDTAARRRRAALATDAPPQATRSDAESSSGSDADPDPDTDAGHAYGARRGAGSPAFGGAPGYDPPAFGDGNSGGPTRGRPSSYAGEAFPSRPSTPSRPSDGAWGERSRTASAPDPRERPAAEAYRTPDDDETGSLSLHGPTGGSAADPALGHPAPRRGGTPAAEVDDDEGGPGGTATLRRAGAPAGLQRTGHVDPGQGHGTDDDYDDGYDDAYDDDEGYDEDLADEDEEARPGTREWVAVAVQVVLGAVLGAMLWVGFSYLWKYLPPVALVLALVSTTGLVFGVRAMRRSDDLQTTVLAVVVGLLVTVSPAVLVLLVGSQG